MGFGPVPPERAVDWTLQIDVEGHAPAQRSKRIDSRLPRPLIALPTQVSGSEPGTDYASLATRDLQRGQAVGLPSGESIAERLAVPALSAEQVGLAGHGWTGATPLWFYILKEADALHDGEQLGPVGGRIVGEVLVGIIDADPSPSGRSTPAGPDVAGAASRCLRPGRHPRPLTAARGIGSPVARNPPRRCTMRRRSLLLVPTAAGLLVTASAPAQTSSPGTFAISERGSLQVASSILTSAGSPTCGAAGRTSRSPAAPLTGCG